MLSRSESFLLPGGLGYIGSVTCVELYKFLAEEGIKRNIQYKIIIADNLANSVESNIDNINQSIANALNIAVDKFVELRVVSLLDLESLKGVFKEQLQLGSPIRYVIHFAALKAVGESVQKPLQYYQNNIVGTLNLLQCMEEYKAPNLIFSSSATVYSPGTYLDEETVFKPSNPYGETKIAIEYLIKSVNRANGGRTISLRYFNPVGSSKDGLLGDSPSVFPNNLFPFIEQVAVGGRPHLNIFGKDYNTPDGTGVRDYIHVVDLALGHIAALRLMIEKDSQNENLYDYFNLGTGVGYSVLQVVNAYSEALGRELPHQYAPRREGDVEILTANPTKATTVLNWKTELGLADMCRDSLNFITKKQQAK